jgi:tRNA(Ile)-lysidine synthase
MKAAPHRQPAAAFVRPRSSLSTSLLQHIRAHEYFRVGDRVAVAVSGGADSVALLRLLLEVRAKLGIVLSVAHLNHQLRGRASDADEKFAAQLAAQFTLPFHVSRADVAAKAKREKANLEDTARRFRYAFFAKLVEDGAATHVAVAHTADDQAETVLAHMLRGTGLTGLGGIHPVADHIVRPLISFRRADLRAYLRSKKQPWREDATNRDTTKTRARIRRKLLPLLEKQFQPKIVEHLATLAELAREDEAYLDFSAEVRAMALFKREAHAASIPVSDLLRRPQTSLREPLSAPMRLKTRAMSKRLIRFIIEELKPRAGQCNAQHVDAVLDLAERGENGKSLPLPGGIEVRRERDSLVFRARTTAPQTNKQQKSPKQFQYDITSLETGVELPVPCLACVFRLTVIDWPAKRGETSDTGPVLDRHALRFPLVLRSWRPGDRLRPVGHCEAHKLKRLLSKKRISRWEREGWPVLTSGGVLAWARGFPVAAEFAASERTQVGILIAEEPFS